jgi:hypothetical protein
MEVRDACAADRFSWGLIAAMVVLFAGLQPAAPILVAPSTVLLPALGVTLLIGLRWVGVTRELPNLVIAAEALLQMTLFTFAGILLSYALAAQGGALWDIEFASWDDALRLDWPLLRAMLDSSFALTWLLTLAYHSLIPQMVVVILLLSANGLHAELRTLVLAAVIAGLTTILLSGLFPALGNLFDAGSYRHLPPAIASMHAPVIEGLRDGSLRTVDLRDMMGIVTFPSYHAALSLLFIGAFRLVPKARVAGTMWAGLTIIATPISGGHYGVDVLAGLALAVLSHAAARALARWGAFSRPPELLPSTGLAASP